MCAFKCSYSVTVLRALGGAFWLTSVSPPNSWFSVTGAWVGLGVVGRACGWVVVGKACGVFLLPGFGVGSSSPQVPWHPTFICDSDINLS